MTSWKEKVADKLSRLLADSSSSPASDSNSSNASIPVERSGSQVLPLPPEKLSRHESTSFSSMILSLLPSSSHIDGSQSNKLENRSDNISSSLDLLSSRWRNKHFGWKKRAVDSSVELGLENAGYQSLEVCDDDEDHVPKRNINGSLNFEKPSKVEEISTAHNSVKSLPRLLDESSFISSDLYEFLHSSLPNIVKGCQWFLLYSTLKHGISLRTLLRKSVDHPGPCLLIAGDMQGAVFGGLLECPLNPTAKRKYQGTNQTFVFTTKYGEPRLFRATGANRYYYLCLDDLLALGGGGSFALYLDGDLLNGTSGPCETFGNQCLAHKSEFELKNVELWGFTHSTRYLT